MEVLIPRGLEEALEWKADHPEAVPIAGGTDLMVDLNFDRSRPEVMIDVSRLSELNTWRREDGNLFLGAGLTYTRALHELPEMRALAQASRSVGSPQIRNRGTIGGNLGTASPAGDAVPVLVAHDGEVVLGAAGDRTRSVSWNEFFLGPKRNAMAPDELILGAQWRDARGPQSFSKVGTRNAMVIAVANLCLVMDEDSRTVRVALGSVGPTDPSATRTVLESSSMTRHRLATAMTIAFRVPTFENDWGPRASLHWAPRISSSGAMAFRFGPRKNSFQDTDRVRSPAAPSTTSPSWATRTGTASPAGDAVPRFPPMVPRLRIWGDPTDLEACASARISGSSCNARVYVRPAPRKRFPSSRRQVFSSDRRETSIMTSGLLRSKFRSTIRSVPPAIGTASGWSAFHSSASSSPRGMRTSIRASSASELPLRERVDHGQHVVAERIQDRAGAPGLDVLADLCSALIRCSGGRDHL